MIDVKESRILYDIRENFGAHPGIDPLMLWTNYGFQNSAWVGIVRGMERNPIVPLWHDSSDGEMQSFLKYSTAQSLMNNLVNLCKNEVFSKIETVNEEVNLAFLEMGVSEEDLQENEKVIGLLKPMFAKPTWFTVDWRDRFLVPLCEGNKAIKVAALSDRIALKYGLEKDLRTGHLYRHLLPFENDESD